MESQETLKQKNLGPSAFGDQEWAVRTQVATMAHGQCVDEKSPSSEAQREVCDGAN